MSRRTFDGVEIGDRLPSVAADVSLATVRRFAKTANMPAGRFTDHDAARREGLPGAIVPGIMRSGTNAETVVTTVATTGQATSDVPFMAAWRESIPFST